MHSSKPINRRQFLLLGCGAAASALLGGAYLISSCPLSNSGICVGPCSAFIDLNQDGRCDRIRKNSQAAATPSSQNQAAQMTSRCPFGLISDPYPGRCGRYVDENGNGLCDLSEVSDDGSQAGGETAQPIEPQPDRNPEPGQLGTGQRRRHHGGKGGRGG